MPRRKHFFSGEQEIAQNISRALDEVHCRQYLYDNPLKKVLLEIRKRLHYPASLIREHDSNYDFKDAAMTIVD